MKYCVFFNNYFGIVGCGVNSGLPANPPNHLPLRIFIEFQLFASFVFFFIRIKIIIIIFYNLFFLNFKSTFI